MMKKEVFLSLILGFLLIMFLFGCKKASVEREKQIESEEEKTKLGVEEEISDVSNVEKELDLGELENIDKELEEINW